MSLRQPAWQKMASHSHHVQHFLRQTNSWGDLFHLPGRHCRSYTYSSPRNRVACSEEVQKIRGSPHHRILAQNNLLIHQGSEKPTYSRKRLVDLATPKRKLSPSRRISPSNIGVVLRRSVRSTIVEANTNKAERNIQNGSITKKPLKVNNLESSSKKSSQRNLDLFGELDSRSSNTYIVASDRLMEMARSKKMVEPVPSESWKLSRAKPGSQRNRDLVDTLSFTKKRHDSDQISWCALRYKASSRTFKLADRSQNIKSDCLISPKSEIRGPTPQRLIELAKPKLRKDKWTRTSPYQVPSRALNAKITPRLIELARPRL